MAKSAENGSAPTYDRPAGPSGPPAAGSGKKSKKSGKKAKKALPNAAKYTRGPSNTIKTVKDKKLKGKLKREEDHIKDAVQKAAMWETLLPESRGYLEAEGMERTYKFKQAAIKQHIDIQTERKMFDLDLDAFGPYRVSYDRAGRYLLMGGKRGHVAMFDWKNGNLGCELHLNETVRDIKFLHNETMFAVAQKKHVYIYDRVGTELHCLRDHIEVNRMAFLPYHFLLVTVGNAGYIKWQDTSTGQLVAQHRTKLGQCSVLAPNPYNAVSLLGHHNGTVTMWAPNMSTPLVKMLCHKGPVQAVACDHSGRYMATSGLDGQLKIWDVRTYKHMNAYYTPTPASTLDISQTGLLGVGFGPHVQIWKDAFTEKQKSPYMSHEMPGRPIDNLAFVPYEDVLGIGHSKGVSSIIVPGAGEANFDTMEVNPYATKRQRQEKEVKQLLEKIPAELITLNPDYLGNVDRAPKEVIEDERRKAWEANNPGQKFEPKFRARGKSSSMRRYLRRQANVVDARREAIKEKLEQQRKAREAARRGEPAEKPRTALDRFASKDKA